MKYLRVRNWEKYQHYKDRNPPWIKLYKTLLDDPEYLRLTDVQKCHLIHLFLYASQQDNRIPYADDVLTKILNVDEPVQVDPLIEAGFLEPLNPTVECPATDGCLQDDSKMQAERLQDDSPREERGEDREQKATTTRGNGNGTPTLRTDRSLDEILADHPPDLYTRLQKVYQEVMETAPKQSYNRAERERIDELADGADPETVVQAWRHFLNHLDRFTTEQAGDASIIWFYEKWNEVIPRMRGKTGSTNSDRNWLERRKQQMSWKQRKEIFGE